jgi:hypothetical protein
VLRLGVRPQAPSVASELVERELKAVNFDANMEQRRGLNKLQCAHARACTPSPPLWAHMSAARFVKDEFAVDLGLGEKAQPLLPPEVRGIVC